MFRIQPNPRKASTWWLIPGILGFWWEYCPPWCARERWGGLVAMNCVMWTEAGHPQLRASKRSRGWCHTWGCWLVMRLMITQLASLITELCYYVQATEGRCPGDPHLSGQVLTNQRPGLRGPDQSRPRMGLVPVVQWPWGGWSHETSEAGGHWPPTQTRLTCSAVFIDKPESSEFWFYIQKKQLELRKRLKPNQRSFDKWRIQCNAMVERII